MYLIRINNNSDWVSFFKMLHSKKLEKLVAQYCCASNLHLKQPGGKRNDLYLNYVKF